MKKGFILVFACLLVLGLSGCYDRNSVYIHLEDIKIYQADTLQEGKWIDDYFLEDGQYQQTLSTSYVPLNSPKPNNLYYTLNILSYPQDASLDVVFKLKPGKGYSFDMLGIRYETMRYQGESDYVEYTLEDFYRYETIDGYLYVTLRFLVSNINFIYASADIYAKNNRTDKRYRGSVFQGNRTYYEGFAFIDFDLSSETEF